MNSAYAKKNKKPRFKKKEIRKQEIMAVARKIFFKKGFQNTHIADIARQADISEGTVYLYFRGKEDLYISLMVPVMEKHAGNLKKLEGRLLNNDFKSGLEFIMAFYQILIDLYHYDKEGLQITQAYLQGNLVQGMSAATTKHVNDLGEINYLLSHNIFKTAKSKGLINQDVDVIMISDVIWSLFMGLIQLEGAKQRFTKKDHFSGTMNYGFSLIAKAVSALLK